MKSKPAEPWRAALAANLKLQTFYPRPRDENAIEAERNSRVVRMACQLEAVRPEGNAYNPEHPYIQRVPSVHGVPPLVLLQQAMARGQA